MAELLFCHLFLFFAAVTAVSAKLGMGTTNALSPALFLPDYISQRDGHNGRNNDDDYYIGHTLIFPFLIRLFVRTMRKTRIAAKIITAISPPTKPAAKLPVAKRLPS